MAGLGDGLPPQLPTPSTALPVCTARVITLPLTAMAAAWPSPVLDALPIGSGVAALVPVGLGDVVVPVGAGLAVGVVGVGVGLGDVVTGVELVLGAGVAVGEQDGAGGLWVGLGVTEPARVPGPGEGAELVGGAAIPEGPSTGPVCWPW